MKQSTSAKRNVQKEKEKSNKELENMMLLAQKYQNKASNSEPIQEQPQTPNATPPTNTETVPEKSNPPPAPVKFSLSFNKKPKIS